MHSPPNPNRTVFNALKRTTQREIVWTEMMSEKYEILQRGKKESGKRTILPSALKPITPHYGIYGFFFTLLASLESSRLLISREGNIKKPKLSLIRGVLLANLHQRCAGVTGYF